MKKIRDVMKMLNDIEQQLPINAYEHRFFHKIKSGHKWAMNGSKWVCSNSLKIMSKKLRDIFGTFMGYKEELNDLNKKLVTFGNSPGETIPKTTQKSLGRVFTDIFNPCVSVQSAFYPMDNKPQRAQRTQRQESILCALCVLCGRLILSTTQDFDKITHRKGRKERKARQQESLRSLRLNVIFAPAPERAPPAPAVRQRLSRAGG